jgi:hypothetical protein
LTSAEMDRTCNRMHCCNSCNEDGVDISRARLQKPWPAPRRRFNSIEIFLLSKIIAEILDRPLKGSRAAEGRKVQVTSVPPHSKCRKEAKAVTILSDVTWHGDRRRLTQTLRCTQHESILQWDGYESASIQSSVNTSWRTRLADLAPSARRFFGCEDDTAWGQGG